MSGPIQQRQAIHLQLKQSEQQLNAMKSQFQATQKLASLGTMACLAAHEFNNLLMPMINYAELALKNPQDTKLNRKALEKVIKHGNAAARIIQSMLGMARDRSNDLETIALRPLIDECFSSLARDFSKDKIDLVIDVPPDLTVTVVPGKFQQVILNLIINARQAMLDRGGRLTISAHTRDDRAVQVRVVDNGSGIDPEIINRIFEPFFSTKTDTDRPDRTGTGQGLAVCRDIMEEHHGAISVNSRPGRGAAFTLTLPAPGAHLHIPEPE